MDDKEYSDKITLNDFAEKFFLKDAAWYKKQTEGRNKEYAGTTAGDYQQWLKNHILPYFGDRDISTLESEEIEQWLYALKKKPINRDSLNQPLSSQSKRHIYNVFNIVMKEAKKQKLIRDNPLQDVEPPIVKSKPREIVNLEDFSKLFPKDESEIEEKERVWNDERARMFFELSLCTGMRFSEVRALQYSSIIWDKKGLLVIHNVDRNGDISLPKNREKRAIPVPSLTMEHLKEYCDSRGINEPDGLVFPSLAGPHWKGKD